MGCGCDNLIVTLESGVLVVQDTQTFSFDGGILATPDPTDPNLVHVALGGVGAVTLQLAYDGGSVIATSLANGPVDIRKGATAPASGVALIVADDNLVANRNVPLVVVIDNSDAPGAEVPTVQLVKNNGTFDAPNLMLVGQDVGVNGPGLELWHDSASPALGDRDGKIIFATTDLGGNHVRVAEVVGTTVVDLSAGNVWGEIELWTRRAGTLGRILTLVGNSAAAEQGCQFISHLPTGTAVPSFYFNSLHTIAGEPAVIVLGAGGGSTLATFDGDGDLALLLDIEAAGGYRDSWGPWSGAVVATTGSGTALALAGTIANDYLAGRSGSITGMRVRLDAAVTAGTLTIEVRINGAVVLTLGVIATSTVMIPQPKDTDSFIATDLIDVTYTSAGMAGATSASVEIEIEE